MQSHQNHAEIKQTILALDIGGSFVKSALMDRAGSCRELPATAIDSAGPADKIVAAVAACITAGLRRADDIGGIGISIPGPFNYTRGVSLMKHKFAGIYGVDLVAALCRIVSAVGDIPVKFRHDANSFLAGEMWKGGAQGYARVGGITLGTGIGVACCLDGEFINNELGSPAPEVSIWNAPYHDGIVEDYISSRALVRKCREICPDYDPVGGVKTIAEAAKNGHQDALRIFSEFGADLGQILRPWCERFRPQAIVFGGQIAKAFSLFEISLRKAVDQATSPPELRRCKLGNAAGLYGVAALFLP